jgi:spore coat protein JB
MNNYNIDRGYYNYINNNYNIPTYEQDVNKSNIFDPYNGLIRGNMFPDLYNTYKIDNPIDIKPMNEQAEMLTYIDALCFACVDLGLYLDVNPDDKDAIELYNVYRTNLGEYMLMYQNKYGPITKTSDSLNAYPWKWNDSPWPWEKGV